MQITSYTDYALRVLIYLASSPNKQATITEISDFFTISRNHLVKVVHQLGSKGFINNHAWQGWRLFIAASAGRDKHWRSGTQYGNSF